MEEWKRVDGFEDYEVSNMGRVRRAVCSKYRLRDLGKIIKPCLDKYGYPQIGLFKNGRHHAKTIHTLVARAFIPNPLGFPQVNHLGPKTDNRATQLEWRSNQGNMHHAVKAGLRGAGVCFDKRLNAWRAYYSPRPNYRVDLGRNFPSREEALAARAAAVAGLIESL